MKRILITGMTASIALFIVSYAVLYLSIRCLPSFFIEYNYPLFNSDGSRDLLFYLHPFVLGFPLAWAWHQLKSRFKGSWIKRALLFCLSYSFVALLPVMWISYSALEVSLTIVAGWLAYGTLQSLIAGLVFAQMDR